MTGSKIATVAADENETESQENQDAMTVTTNGNKINVAVDVDSLNTFNSTNPSQGSGKWIGLAINTGESDITNVTYNGYALTSDDVAEAASVGVGAGSFVLWLKAESIFPKTITLGTVDGSKADTQITITLNA